MRAIERVTSHAAARPRYRSWPERTTGGTVNVPRSGASTGDAEAARKPHEENRLPSRRHRKPPWGAAGRPWCRHPRQFTISRRAHGIRSAANLRPCHCPRRALKQPDGGGARRRNCPPSGRRRRHRPTTATRGRPARRTAAAPSPSAVLSAGRIPVFGGFVGARRGSHHAGAQRVGLSASLAGAAFTRKKSRSGRCRRHAAPIPDRGRREVVRHLSFAEAAGWHFGAKVLHPARFPAVSRNIRSDLNSHRPQPRGRLSPPIPASPGLCRAGLQARDHDLWHHVHRMLMARFPAARVRRFEFRNRRGRRNDIGQRVGDDRRQSPAPTSSRPSWRSRT